MFVTLTSLSANKHPNVIPRRNVECTNLPPNSKLAVVGKNPAQCSHTCLWVHYVYCEKMDEKIIQVKIMENAFRFVFIS